MGEYLHVRVKLDVSKPLFRGSMFFIDEEEFVWVRFLYETNFYYWCGCLGHNEKECQ